MPVADLMQISATKPRSISGSDDYSHILSVVPSMVTCHRHFLHDLLEPHSIVAFYRYFLLLLSIVPF